MAAAARLVAHEIRAFLIAQGNGLPAGIVPSAIVQAAAGAGGVQVLMQMVSENGFEGVPRLFAFVFALNLHVHQLLGAHSVQDMSFIAFDDLTEACFAKGRDEIEAMRKETSTWVDLIGTWMARASTASGLAAERVADSCATTLATAAQELNSEGLQVLLIAVCRLKPKVIEIQKSGLLNPNTFRPTTPSAGTV